MASIPATIFVRDGDGWVQTSPEDSVNSTPYFYVPDERAEEYIKLIQMKKKAYEGLDMALPYQTSGSVKSVRIPYKPVSAISR